MPRLPPLFGYRDCSIFNKCNSKWLLIIVQHKFNGVTYFVFSATKSQPTSAKVFVLSDFSLKNESAFLLKRKPNG